MLEAIPRDVAAEVSRTLDIPTIGIGAGPDCDDQVLVINDLIGLNEAEAPTKFNREYCAVREPIRQLRPHHGLERQNAPGASASDALYPRA